MAGLSQRFCLKKLEFQPRRYCLKKWRRKRRRNRSFWQCSNINCSFINSITKARAPSSILFLRQSLQLSLMALFLSSHLKRRGGLNKWQFRTLPSTSKNSRMQTSLALVLWERTTKIVPRRTGFSQVAPPKPFKNLLKVKVEILTERLRMIACGLTHPKFSSNNRLDTCRETVRAPITTKRRTAMLLSIAA